MEDLLFCRYLYDPIEENCIQPVDKSDGDWKKMNRKTISVTRQWIDQSIYHHVLGETLAYNLWKRLSELSKNSLNKTFLIRKLVNLKYKDGSNDGVLEQFSGYGESVNYNGDCIR